MGFDGCDYSNPSLGLGHFRHGSIGYLVDLISWFFRACDLFYLNGQRAYSFGRTQIPCSRVAYFKQLG